MARGRSPRRSRVRKCKLPKCNRKVDVDRAGSEYCYQHEQLSLTPEQWGRGVSFAERFSDAETDRERNQVYREMYIPNMTFLSRKDFILSTSKNGLDGLSGKTIDTSIKSWMASSKGINIFNPQEAYANRDKLIEDVSQSLKKQGANPSLVELEDGRTFDLDGTFFSVSDHKAIHVYDEPSDREGMSSYIIDVATTAPFKDAYDGDIRQHLAPGDISACGMNIMHLAEYGFSGIKWGTITLGNGEVLWKEMSEDDEYVKQQIELVNSSPPIIPNPIQYASAEKYYDDVDDNVEETVEEVSDIYPEDEQRIIDEMLRAEEERSRRGL